MADGTIADELVDAAVIAAPARSGLEQRNLFGEAEVMVHFAAWKRGDADLVTDRYRELTGQRPMSLGSVGSG